MNSSGFTLIVDRFILTVASTEELIRQVETAIGSNSHVIALELRKGAYPKRWEKMLYPLLGLKVPEDVSRLTLYSDGSRILVTFEEADIEWAPKPSSMHDVTMIKFKTEVGEVFEASANECVTKGIALQLVSEFYDSKKKPSMLPWKRNG